MILTVPPIAGLFVVRLTTPGASAAAPGWRRPGPTRGPRPCRSGRASPSWKGARRESTRRRHRRGGLAGQRCAETLRRRGYEGAVTMVCAEPELPYDPTPALQGCASRGRRRRRASLSLPAWYADKQVELLLAERATALDPLARRLELASGRALGYGDLLIATGAAPRLAARARGVHQRSPAAHARRREAPARRAGARRPPGDRRRGLHRPGGGRDRGRRGRPRDHSGGDAAAAGRAAGRPIGRWLAELHAAAGVRVLLSAQLTGARGNGRVEELLLAGGRTVACDTVVVGVGRRAGRRLACRQRAGSGRESPPTPRAGPRSRTCTPPATSAEPSIRGAGCTRGPSTGTPPPGRAPRRRPRCSATTRSRRRCRASGAISTASGSSNVGHAEDADSVRVDGEPDACDFSVLYSRGGRPVAALTVGRPRELIALRRRIEDGHDVNTQPKEMAA